MTSGYRERLQRGLSLTTSSDLLINARRVLETCSKQSPARVRNDLDQCPATISTVLRRLQLLLPLLNECPRSVLLLGDDDLLGLALAATELPERITVLDLDDAVL